MVSATDVGAGARASAGTVVVRGVGANVGVGSAARTGVGSGVGCSVAADVGSGEAVAFATAASGVADAFAVPAASPPAEPMAERSVATRPMGLVADDIVPIPIKTAMPMPRRAFAPSPFVALG